MTLPPPFGTLPKIHQIGSGILPGRLTGKSKNNHHEVEKYEDCLHSGQKDKCLKYSIKIFQFQIGLQRLKCPPEKWVNYDYH